MRYRLYLWLILSLSFAASACDRSRVDASGSTEEGLNAADYVIAKLEKIVIPVINLEDASIDEAIDFLRMRSFDLEEGPPERRGVSWIVKSRSVDAADSNAGGLDPVEPSQVPKINYSAKEVGLLTAMEEIARQAHLDVYLTNVGIVICPSGEQALPVGKVGRR